MKTQLCLIVSVIQLINGAHATTYYVAPNGNDNNTGLTINVPFQTVNKAILTVQPGDEIQIRQGIYREMITVPLGSTGTAGNPIIIQPYQNETVVIKGSDLVTDWEEFDNVNHIWRTPWTNNSQQVFVHGTSNFHINDEGYPLQQINMPNGSPYSIFTTNGVSYTNYFWTVPYNFSTPPLAAGPGTITNVSYWPDSSVLQGTNYYVLEEGAIDYMMSPSGSGTFYYAENSHYLYIRLKDDSAPTSRGIEVSTRLTTLLGNAPATYMVFKNLKFRHASAPISGFAMGAGPWTTYDSCDIQWLDFGGLSLHANCVATNCIIMNNGSVGGNGGPNSLFTHCLISSNNYRNFSHNFNCGGIKCYTTSRSDAGGVENCEVSWNLNSPGIWFDTIGSTDSSIIRNNFIHHNGFSGIYAEVSQNTKIHNNLLVSNTGYGIRVSGAEGLEFVNNTIIGTCWSTDWGSAAAAFLPDDRLATKDCKFYNNIIYSGSELYAIVMLPILSADCSNNVGDYNCFYRPGDSPVFQYGNQAKSLTQWQSATGNDIHSITKDPAFLGRAPLFGTNTANFALSYPSPCIDAGTNLTVITDDFLGTPRNSTGTNDIGAFEFMRDENGNGIDDNWERFFEIANLNLDYDDDRISNLNEYYAGTDPTQAPVIYVDIVNGNPAFTGFSPIYNGTWDSFLEAWKGPKQTINSAITVSRSGDEIRVNNNYNYNETIDLRQKNVLLKVVSGTVNLRNP